MALAATLAQRRIYYGWYIVGVSFLVNLVSLGLNVYAPSVLLKPMTQELGWSRGFFSLSLSIGGLLSAPLALVIGPIVDRQGAQRLILLGGLVIGGATIASGFVYAEWQFLILRSILAPMAMAGLGQLVAQVAVSNWFARKRGRALGFAIAGIPAGGIVMVPLTTYLVSALGWRQAWIVLGVIGWALVLVPAALFMKRRPEDLGLLPDGARPEAWPGPERRDLPSEVTWTRREALRTPALWLFAFGFPMGLAAVAALTSHLYPYLTDIHLSRQTAAAMTSILAFASMGIKPVWGYIAERVPPKYCIIAMYAMMGMGLALLTWVGTNQAALYLVVIFLGSAFGGIIVLQALLWANYFGRMSLARVQSLAMPISTPLSLIGPTLAGFMWDITGSYRGIFIAYIAAEALAAFLMLLAQPPRKPGTAVIR